MTWTLVIGPTKWKPGYQPEFPDGLRELLPHHWKTRGHDVLWPIDIRALLAGLLRREGVRAVLMEDDAGKKGESHSAHFARLARTHRDGRFFAYWPLKANLSGLIWELSHLGGRIDEKAILGRQVHLFLQEGVVGLDSETDTLVFLEEGNRTTYFEDLGRWGCGIDVWMDHDSLIHKVLEVGAEYPPSEK